MIRAGLGIVLAGLCCPAVAATWRIGDRNQPWRLHPVSFVMDTGVRFKPDYEWGGQHAAEIAVDDDGDGLIDEDPVNLFDDDGDGRYNEDGPNPQVDDDGDGLLSEDPIDGEDNDGDGVVDEDPIESEDDDQDGLYDEDGPDPQLDDDGDGLLNEDGLFTGGVIHDPELREGYTREPFFRYATPEEARADARAWGSGYGWGDDDCDARFNEDPVDGADNDGDGLVDEDDTAAPTVLPDSWARLVFAYDRPGGTAEGEVLSFTWDPAQRAYRAVTDAGETVVARAVQQTFRPTDWLRPIRLDRTRNVARLVEDRFLAGVFGKYDPIGTQGWGGSLTGSVHLGISGHGQVVDGSMHTARVASGGYGSAGFTVDLRGLFLIDLLRLGPRPDFWYRTPTAFGIRYGGDGPGHIAEVLQGGQVETRLIVREDIIPLQTEQAWPAVKEFRFDGGEYGDPKRVRVLVMRGLMPQEQTWELAEFEAYGRGYAMDASYVTEIIDLGMSQPRYRRYFEEGAPNGADDDGDGQVDEPMSFESVQTADGNRNGTIDPGELAQAILARQYDPGVPGRPVIWGKLRWHGQSEGNDGHVQVRVRAGTSLDVHVYHRRLGAELVPHIEEPLVADWPARGERIDAHAFAMLSGPQRPPVGRLPYNAWDDADGLAGGWTPWSEPFGFSAGLVDEIGEGGVWLPLPMSRYVQFRLDFAGSADSAVSLDYLELEYGTPACDGGILAEIFPNRAPLGTPTEFAYGLLPQFSGLDPGGFNRIDIAVPSLETEALGLSVDGLEWSRLPGSVPEGVDPASWLKELSMDAEETFAAAVYEDVRCGPVLGIKTRSLRAADFPASQDRPVQIRFRTSVSAEVTDFRSWVWDESGPSVLRQTTQAGDAVGRMPGDITRVTRASNAAPQARADEVSVPRDSSIVIPVLLNDADVDGDALTIGEVGVPGHGTAIIGSGDSTVTYFPDSGFTGRDSFTYAIADGLGGTAAATVEVTVLAAGEEEELPEGALARLTGSGYATFSPDSSALVVGAVLYDAATLELAGYFSWSNLGKAVFSDDGAWLARVRGDTEIVLIWHLAKPDITDRYVWGSTIETRSGVFTHERPVPAMGRAFGFEVDGFPISAAAFGDGGRLLAAGSKRGLVKVWDIMALDEVVALAGHNGEVQSLRFHPNGRILASAGADGTVRLWDVRDGSELAVLTGHEGSVPSVCFTRDGSLLVSAGADGTIRLWDVAARGPHSVLMEAGEGVLSLALSRAGDVLASGHQDGVVRLWDVDDWQERDRFEGPTGPVYWLSFSADGSVLASSGSSTTVLWQVSAERPPALEVFTPPAVTFVARSDTFYLEGDTTAVIPVLANDELSPGYMRMSGSYYTFLDSIRVHGVTQPVTTASARWDLGATDAQVQLDLNPLPGNQHQRARGGVRPGEELLVSVYARQVADNSGFSVELLYDPDELEFLRVDGQHAGEENLLTRAGSAFFLPTQPAGGTVEFGGGLPGTDVAASGDGLLAVFSFTVRPDVTGNEIDVHLGRIRFQRRDGSLAETGAAGSAVFARSGVASIDTTGTAVLYTPPAGFVGVETFTYTVSHGEEISSTGTVTVVVGEHPLTAVVGSSEGTEAELPEHFRVAQNAPNPFNQGTAIRFAIPADASTETAKLEIFNVAGQVVRVLVDGEAYPGHHRVVWDGRDDAGRPVGSGVYLYRLRTESFAQTRRMLLLR